MSYYEAVFKDGTVISNLSYDASEEIFEEARDTENPCILRPMNTQYNPT